MASGYSRELNYERPCKCGKGTVIRYKEIEWSDYRPDKEVGYELINTCTDNCEK